MGRFMLDTLLISLVLFLSCSSISGKISRYFNTLDTYIIEESSH